MKTNTFYGVKSIVCFVLVVLDDIMKELQESIRGQSFRSYNMTFKCFGAVGLVKDTRYANFQMITRQEIQFYPSLLIINNFLYFKIMNLAMFMMNHYPSNAI